MLLVFCGTVSLVFAAMALTGARGWNNALQNGSEEDVVQSYRKVFYRSTAVLVLLGGIVGFSFLSDAPTGHAKPKPTSKITSPRNDSGIS